MEVGSAIDVKALFNLTYGMYIVSTEWEGRKNGQIANSVMQVTASPNTVAVCLNKDNLTWELLEKSGKFSVTVLEEEVPMTFIGTFGFKSGRDIDKFASCGWMAAPGGHARRPGPRIVLDRGAGIQPGGRLYPQRLFRRGDLLFLPERGLPPDLRELSPCQEGQIPEIGAHL